MITLRLPKYRLRSEEHASMNRLHELSTRLAAAADLASSLREVLDAAMELQGADLGVVQLYDEVTETLKIVAHRGFDQDFVDRFETVNANDTWAGSQALRAGGRIVIGDVQTHAEDARHLGTGPAIGYRSVQATPLLDRNSGKPIGILSTLFRAPHRLSAPILRLTDLCARQAADVIAFQVTEQRLRESEAKLQAAVDLLKLGCYAWDPQTDEVQWDDRSQSLLDLPEDAPRDMQIWRNSVHPDDRARVEAALQRCIDAEGDGTYDVEYRTIARGSGPERWIATRGQTQFQNGKAVSFYGVARDITDRKRIERALEHGVEARTRETELANGQLRLQVEHRKIAEATVDQLQRLDAIGQITSGVAHDFNNLLSIVLTNARLLSRKVHDEDDQEGVGLIRAAAERGTKLTAQLLAFSHKQRLEPHPVDLNNEIEDMRDLLGATLGGTVHFETQLEPGLWPALVDPTQIELIILNLAINARDAMQSGGKLVIKTFNATIESVPTQAGDPPPGDHVGLAVIDTGTGIADDVVPRVFEAFFTTKGPGKGSGLGLAQVFGIARQSGGGVRLKTRVGEGTSVKVYLPRAAAAAATPEREAANAALAPPERRRNILVVDDDRQILISIGRMLDFLGYVTIGAESGEAALRMIDGQSQIDLVLADFAMPGLTGIELANAIHTKRPALPVIVMTGYADTDVGEQFVEWSILQKPFTEKALADRIAAALS
jgi:PAS domain S-box-containing protein